MSLLHFSDILEKAGLDPAKVKLIRHSLGDKDFSKCYYSEPQMVLGIHPHSKARLQQGVRLLVRVRQRGGHHRPAVCLLQGERRCISHTGFGAGRLPP